MKTLTRRVALRKAKALGCEVILGNGGEVRVVPPAGFGPRLNLNNRKHDAGIDLLVLIKRLEDRA